MAISITEALALIHDKVASLSGEIIPIEESLGRIVADDYAAQFDLPPFDNSAMDGYAVVASDNGKVVKSDKTLYAGSEACAPLQAGEAIRIMTGAPIPAGCDAIVPIEEIEMHQDGILLPPKIPAQAHIRKAGEDIRKGAPYIGKGERITAYGIALLASQGVTHLHVVRRPRVAVFGTGDELRPYYERIEAYQLYNSNTPMFLARAKELGCQTSAIEGGKDTLESLQECIRQALDADLIVTSGGVSVGDKDFTKDAFKALGMELFFSGVDIKPGKPTTIGRINSTIIVNLPGNPLAAMVNFELFARAVIRKLSGVASPYFGAVETRMRSEQRLKAGKYTVILGGFDGASFSPLPKQSPGMVSPLPKADGLIITLPEVSVLGEGDRVKMIPIKWEMFQGEQKEIFTSSSLGSVL